MAMRRPISRVLGHRHQHDVHDADAADDQRHERDAGQQSRHRAGRLRPQRDDVLERLHHHVVRIARGHIVPQAQDRADRVCRLADVIRRAGGRDDVVQVLLTGELLHHGRVGRKRLVVHVLAARGGALGRHDAEHVENLILHADVLVGRIDASPNRLSETFEPSTIPRGGLHVLLGEERAVFSRQDRMGMSTFAP
jgi:hypothetical protein